MLASQAALVALHSKNVPCKTELIHSFLKVDKVVVKRIVEDTRKEFKDELFNIAPELTLRC